MISLAPPILSLVSPAKKILDGDDPSLIDAFSLIAAISAGNSELKVAPSTASDNSMLDVASTAQKPNLDEQALSNYSGVLNGLTPSLGEQLQNNTPFIVTKSEVINANRHIDENGNEHATFVVKQQVVESRYFDLGNILDVVKSIREGHLPSFDQALGAIADGIDVLTLHMVKPYLLPTKIDSHVKAKYIEINVDNFSKVSETSLPSMPDERTHHFKVSRPGAVIEIDAIKSKTIDTSVTNIIQGQQITYTSFHPVSQGTEFSPDLPLENKQYKSAVAHLVATTESTSTCNKGEILAINSGKLIAQQVFQSPSKNDSITHATSRIYQTSSPIDHAFAEEDPVKQLSENQDFILKEQVELDPEKSVSFAEGHATISGVTNDKESRLLPIENVSFSINDQSGQNNKLKNHAGINGISYVLQADSQGQNLKADIGIKLADDAIESFKAYGVDPTLFDGKLGDAMIYRDVKKTSKSLPTELKSETIEHKFKPGQVKQTFRETVEDNEIIIDRQAIQSEYKITHDFFSQDSNVLKNVLEFQDRAGLIQEQSIKKDTTRINTKTETYTTLFGHECKKFLGSNAEAGPTEVMEVSTPKYATYLTDKDVFGLLKADDLSQATVEQESVIGQSESTSYLDDSTRKSVFQEGWVNYLPLGSVVNTGVKSSYGVEVTASDYFWAAIDAGTTFATLGTGAALSTALKATGKGVGRAVVEGSMKQVLKESSKGMVNIGKAVGQDVIAASKDIIKMREGFDSLGGVAKRHFRDLSKNSSPIRKGETLLFDKKGLPSLAMDRKDIGFYLQNHSVKMPKAVAGQSATSKGYLRDKNLFWNKYQEMHPNSLSSTNAARINSPIPKSPIVDKQWIKTHPMHEKYFGDVLHHHHYNHGKIAIPLPQTMHIGSSNSKVWHR